MRESHASARFARTPPRQKVFCARDTDLSPTRLTHPSEDSVGHDPCPNVRTQLRPCLCPHRTRPNVDYQRRRPRRDAVVERRFPELWWGERGRISRARWGDYPRYVPTLLCPHRTRPNVDYQRRRPRRDAVVERRFPELWWGERGRISRARWGDYPRYVPTLLGRATTPVRVGRHRRREIVGLPASRCTYRLVSPVQTIHPLTVRLPPRVPSSGAAPGPPRVRCEPLAVKFRS